MWSVKNTKFRDGVNGIDDCNVKNIFKRNMKYSSIYMIWSLGTNKRINKTEMNLSATHNQTKLQVSFICQSLEPLMRNFPIESSWHNHQLLHQGRPKLLFILFSRINEKLVGHRTLHR